MKKTILLLFMLLGGSSVFAETAFQSNFLACPSAKYVVSQKNLRFTVWGYGMAWLAVSNTFDNTWQVAILLHEYFSDSVEAAEFANQVMQSSAAEDTIIVENKHWQNDHTQYYYDCHYPIKADFIADGDEMNVVTEYMKDGTVSMSPLITAKNWRQFLQSKPYVLSSHHHIP